MSHGNIGVRCAVVVGFEAELHLCRSITTNEPFHIVFLLSFEKTIQLTSVLKNYEITRITIILSWLKRVFPTS